MEEARLCIFFFNKRIKQQALLFLAESVCGHTVPGVSSSAHGTTWSGRGAQPGPSPLLGVLTVVTTTAFLFLSSRQRRCLDQLLLKRNNAFKMKLTPGASNCDKGQVG